MKRLLLDTNVVVWLLAGDQHSVSDDAVQALLFEDNHISLSAVTVWEIAIKRSLGKLKAPDDWARELTKLDFAQMTITAEHTARVERLPHHHGDPFDRLLVAQAQLEGHALITPDKQMAGYDVEVLW